MAFGLFVWDSGLRDQAHVKIMVGTDAHDVITHLRYIDWSDVDDTVIRCHVSTAILLCVCGA